MKAAECITHVQNRETCFSHANICFSMQNREKNIPVIRIFQIAVRGEGDRKFY